MKIAELLERLKYENKMSAREADLLADLHDGRLYSLRRELRFCLYAGILLVIAGVGLTVKQYFANLGDLLIILTLTSCSAASLIYCFLKGGSFSRGEVVSPHIAFDFILFFGCAFYSMDVAYVESQFSLLGAGWKEYLLFSSALFLFLAYRFDNRLVLSMALSTLAAWFGFTLSLHSFFSFAEHYRLYAIAYALIVLAAGGLSYRLAVKKHFLDIYLNFAVHVLCIALIMGIADRMLWSPYFPLLVLTCGALAFYAVKVRRFLYMLYALIYAYIGVSILVVDRISRETFFVFAYFIATSLVMIGLIFKMSRKFREAE